MARRTPFTTEVAVIKKRLSSSVKETMDEFNMSRMTVNRIMERNPEVVATLRQQVIDGANMGAIHDA